MAELIPVDSVDDILPAYRGTPVERLLRYHNLGEPGPAALPRPELFIATCIDNREALTFPHNFAYVLRTAGVRLHGNEFELAYAVAIGGVAAVALVAHTDCGMAHVKARREEFVRGLVERGGAGAEEAGAHFDAHVGEYAIADPAEAVVAEAAEVRTWLPRVLVAPLLYRVEDDRLVQIADAGESSRPPLPSAHPPHDAR
jgi:carbonic anhydrase